MTTLKEEFARLKPRLERDAKAMTVEGAYARAMLAFMPALINHLDLDRTVHQAKPADTFEGICGGLSNVVMHTLRESFPPAQRSDALQVMLRHIFNEVMPLLERTRSGIIVPGGLQ